MNAITSPPALPDVQAGADRRNLVIQKVGVKDVRHPVLIAGRDGVQASVASVDMYVRLPGDQKGTHMSRFLELLNGWSTPLSTTAIAHFAVTMLQKLDADGGYVEMRFPYFRRKAAPVSGVESLLDYEATLAAELGERGLAVTLTVATPVTSLCPCSKEISRYGAHNQRSRIAIAATVAPGAELDPESLIEIAEASASCALWGVLKRPDEKFVTEAAYENPKFVEDLVRDVAIALSDDLRVSRYEICSENFESIHNHSAFALLRGP